MDLPDGPRDLGLVTVAEALQSRPVGLGLTPDAVRWRVASGRWQRLHHGVYLVRPGPIDWLTSVGAALLAHGADAAVGDASAAYLWDLGEQPRDVHIVVPRTSAVRAHAGTRLRRANRLSVVARWPARTTIESTVVDVARTGSADDLAGLIHRALRSRRTTAARVLKELDDRTRHPQRQLLADLLAESASGSEGPLEVRFVRGVLRRHRLPTGVAQFPFRQVVGSGGLVPGQVVGSGGLVPGQVVGWPGGWPGPESRWDDRRRADRALPEFRVIVELDGRLFHPLSRQAADRAKSNAAARAQWLLLRYGWAEVVDRPCVTAAEIAGVLRERGWSGSARPCGPGCLVARGW